MILLEANNEYLDITASNLNFNMTLRSPFFGYLSSFVYNFTIPYTAKNARIFYFPDRLNRINKTQATCPGRILIDGIEAASGTWKAKAHGEEYIELAFIFKADDFIEALNGVQVSDLFDEEITVDDIVTHVTDVAKTKVYPETEYQFPSVYAPEFYGSVNPNFLGVINNFESDIFYKDSIIYNTNTIVPMLYLFAVLDRIWEATNYSVRGEIFENTMLQKCLLINNYALDKLKDVLFKGIAENTLVTEFGFHIINWDEVIDDADRYEAGLYNIALEGEYEVYLNINFKGMDFGKTYHYLIDIVNTPVGNNDTVIHTVGGVTDFSSSVNVEFTETFSDLELGTLYIKIRVSELYETGNPYYDVNVLFGTVIIRHLSDSGLNYYNNTFNLKNHSPDFSALDFFKMFCEEYQLFPVFDNVSKTINIFSFTDVLSSNLQLDLSQGLLRNSLRVEQNIYDGIKLNFVFDNEQQQYFIPDSVDNAVNSFADLRGIWIKFHDVYFIRSLQAYYNKVVVELDDGSNINEWQVISHHPNEFLDGNGADNRVLKFVPCMMRNVFTSKNKHPRSMPTILGTGTSKAFGLINESPLRVMFFAGYWLGTSGIENKYPFATSTKYDTEGNIIFPYNYNAEGVAANFWMPTIEWLKTRLRVEFERDLTAFELKTIALNKRQFLLDTAIIIEELYIELNKELDQGKVKGWTI
jgi:hypothetical protein